MKNSIAYLIIMLRVLTALQLSWATNFTLINKTSGAFKARLHSEKTCSGADYRLKQGERKMEKIHGNSLHAWGEECCATSVELSFDSDPKNKLQANLSDPRGGPHDGICRNATIEIEGDPTYVQMGKVT